MRFSALALTSILGVGIPAYKSSATASEETTTTAERQNLRSDLQSQQRQQTQTLKKTVTRTFHALPDKPRSLFQLKKQRTADLSTVRNFELCELSSRTITKTPSTINPTSKYNIDIGILGGNGCSSENNICILPNLVGFQDTSSSEPIDVHHDDHFNVDPDEQIYTKIALGICYPTAAINEFYLAAVTTKTEIQSSMKNAENDNQDHDNHTLAPTNTESTGYSSYYYSSYSDYDLENVTLGDMDDAPATLIDDYYLSTSYTDDETHSGNGKNRDLANVESKSSTKLLRMSQIGEEISHNALKLRDSHYLQCMNYCSEFDRPQIAEWLATQTPSGPWPMLEELIFICRDAYHYIHNLGFTGIPHYCPFDPMMPLNCWDMSGVTTLETAFREQNSFNQPLDCWDTSAVTTTAGMFAKAYAFNQNIDTWNTSLVEDMTETFSFAVNFNHPLGHWETGRVTDISRMFFGANQFNSHIDSWNVTSVQSMDLTFFAAQNFNQPLGNWSTPSLTRLNNTFVAAFSFNQPIGSWDVSGVTSLRSTFTNAFSFNQPLNTWDVSNVVDMDYTFLAAKNFNQSLDMNSKGDSYWNIRSARSMKQMFCRTSFDQCISTWPNHISNQYGVNETATFGMFFEAACPVELEMGTPSLDKGPWCQGKRQGCHKAKGTKKGFSVGRRSRGSVKSSKSKSSKYRDHLH